MLSYSPAASPPLPPPPPSPPAAPTCCIAGIRLLRVEHCTAKTAGPPPSAPEEGLTEARLVDVSTRPAVAAGEG